MLLTLAEVHGLGLEPRRPGADGGYYWDRNDKTAISPIASSSHRPHAEHDPGGHLFATLQYLKAVKAAGTRTPKLSPGN